MELGKSTGESIQGQQGLRGLRGCWAPAQVVARAASVFGSELDFNDQEEAIRLQPMVSCDITAPQLSGGMLLNSWVFGCARCCKPGVYFETISGWCHTENQTNLAVQRSELPFVNSVGTSGHPASTAP